MALANVARGFKQFDLTGLHEDDLAHLTSYGQEWLLPAGPDSYDEVLARQDHEQAVNEEYKNTVIPHLGGVTVGEVFANFDAWQARGLMESDGWFVWVGDDSYHGGPVIEMYEMPEADNVRADIHWYCQQGHSLYKAIELEEQLQFDTLKWMVIELAGG
jgi:hypothetical protein